MKSVCVALCLVLGLGLARGSPTVFDTFSNKVLGTAVVDDSEDARYKIPDGFLLGAGTSSYQVEGAWDVDGKGVSVFDYYYHSKNYSVERTGDIAADFYHRYKEDIALAKKMGFNVFRMSMSWARIFPDGYANTTVNPLGVQYYHNVLDEMIRQNITPFVTIFHFEYPQVIEDDIGGWLSDKMPKVFADYSDFLFEEYGSKVKHWLSINEASMYCALTSMIIPPLNTDTTEKKNTCLHNLILGHALSHKRYHDKYSSEQKGLVGFGIGPGFSKPKTNSSEDQAAAERNNVSHGMAVSIDPLFFGDYPEEAKSGRPTFTDEQKALIKGRIDFVGSNIYGGSVVSANDTNGGDDGPPGGGGGGPPGGGDGPPGGGDGPPGGGDGPPGGGDGPPGGGGGPSGGGGGGGGHGSSDAKDAWCLREMPKWVKKRYGNLPVFITESGTNTGTTIDDWDTRAVFSSAYLRELVAGVNVDGNNVLGITIWSFIDSFEFGISNNGWGLVHVDYQNGSLNRTLKRSSAFFMEMNEKGFVPLVESSSAAPIKGSIVTAVVALLALKWLM